MLPRNIMFETIFIDIPNIQIKIFENHHSIPSDSLLCPSYKTIPNSYTIPKDNELQYEYWCAFGYVIPNFPLKVFENYYSINSHNS